MGRLSAVLDAWALVAFMRNEAAADRVEKAIIGGDAVASSVNLGEALYTETRRRGDAPALKAVDWLSRRVTVDEPDWALTVAAARLKAHNRISYADAFAVATAQKRRLPLWTGDPEIIALAGQVTVVDLR